MLLVLSFDTSNFLGIEKGREFVKREGTQGLQPSDCALLFFLYIIFLSSSLDCLTVSVQLYFFVIFSLFVYEFHLFIDGLDAGTGFPCLIQFLSM